MSDQPKFDVLIGRYVRLRDTIKEADKAHKEKLAPFRDMLEELGNQMLGMLHATGQDSAASAHGTVYKTTRKSASLADPAEFRRFVIGGELWDLADWKANPTAIEQFIGEHGAQPPGVNFQQVIEVGVRRK
jgi:hypothetical protein